MIVTSSFGCFFSSEKSECQQLICEIIRATPEAATSETAVQTARKAKKGSAKEKRQVLIHQTV